MTVKRIGQKEITHSILKSTAVVPEYQCQLCRDVFLSSLPNPFCRKCKGDFKSRLFIFGAGGHGKIALDIYKNLNRKVSGFIDDDKQKFGKSINEISINTLDYYIKHELISSDEIFVAIGSNKWRKIIYLNLKEYNIAVPSAIDSRTIISDSVSFNGEGIMLVGGSIVNIDTKIETGVIINTGTSIDHDCIIGEFTHIAPGTHLAGEVTIGKNVFIGIGVSIIPGITIEDNTIIGAGAVVIRDVMEGETVVGVPAKRIK